MMGYWERYEDLKKPAARLEDLLDLVPARVTQRSSWLPSLLKATRSEHGAPLWTQWAL